MTAALLTHSYVGAPIGSAAASAGKTGLVWEVVGVTCTENGDWIVLSEFEEILGAAAFAVSGDVHTQEAVEVDTAVDNKIILTAGGTDVMRILVWGTPAISN